MNFDFNEVELRRLDLNLLLVFTAVIRTGGAKTAAERLRLGQPAVSMALSRLRREIGDPLFVRGKTGLEPTLVARRLFDEVCPALQTISTAFRGLAEFTPSESERTFRIGLTDDLEWWLFPDIRARIAAEAPRSVVIARTVDHATADDQLREGRLDVAITAQPARHRANVLCEGLYSEDFIVVAAQDCALPDPLSLADYLSFPHVLVSAAGTPWGIMDAELERRGVRRDVVSVVQHFLTVPALLGSHGPIATIPRHPGRSMAARFGLQVRELPVASPNFQTSFLWHRRSVGNPALVWLRTRIIQSVSEASAKPTGATRDLDLGASVA